MGVIKGLVTIAVAGAVVSAAATTVLIAGGLTCVWIMRGCK